MLPKHVKVGPMTYTVEVVNGMFESDSLYGRVDYANHHIQIAGDVSPERQRMAYVHELTHAMLFESGRVREYYNEPFVRQLGSILTSVIVDNGWTITNEG